MKLKTVDKILDKNKSALEAQLSLNAIQTASEAVKATEKHRETISKIAKEYVKQYSKGGSYCPDPNNLGKAKFVNWIDESYANAKVDIQKYLKVYEESKNPSDLSKGLEEAFKEMGLSGNPTKDINKIIQTDIDARRVMRTETEKIRTAAKIENMKTNNVEYVRYIAVMDDRVRPEHAALNGHIFPINEAPILGEPNCRCTYGTATEKQYKKENETYGTKKWTAQEAQKWVKTPDGKATGYANEAKRLAKSELEKKRQIFEDAMKNLKGEQQRLKVLEAMNMFKPDWCKVGIKDIIEISPEAFVPYKQTQEVTTDVFDIPIKETKQWDKESLDWLKENVKESQRLMNDFPKLKGFVTEVTPETFKVRKGELRLADFDSGTRALRFNNDITAKELLIKAKDMTMEIKVGKTVRKLPVNMLSETGVLNHELGHAVFSKYAEVVGKNPNEKFFTAFFAKHPEYDERKIKNFIKLQSPSVYGTTNTHEFFSECFADYYANGENAQKISKDIVEMFKELLA